MKFIIIKTTYPNLKSAKNLAKILLSEKLAACIQFTKIETNYSWQNKIIEEKEALVTIKTNQKLYKKIEKIIVKNHEYKIPQILSFEIKNGYEPYLEWIGVNTK